MIDAELIIKKLELEKHIHEGGYFKESYRSLDMISKNGFHDRKHEGKISEDTSYPERGTSCFNLNILLVSRKSIFSVSIGSKAMKFGIFIWVVQLQFI